MYTIGEFAMYGRVSVRMLRHYDAIGLLRPARVDPSSGYRSYDAAQFATLGRIMGLRDLGIGLERIRGVIDGSTDAAGTRALLAARRAELFDQIAADHERIHRLDERLRHLEGERVMSTAVELKSIAPVTVLEASAIAPGGGPENVTPVIEPLYDRLSAAITAAGLPVREPGYALYELVDPEREGAGIRVRAGFTGDPADPAGEGYEVVTLPEVPLAATILHHGVMSRIGESWDQLMEWMSENGYRPVGLCREVYLVVEPLPQEEWVTELQQPVEKI